MPKTKQKCEEIREKTRQKIIEKSILYFSKNGVSGTKISDLCKDIGIAPGSIYNYFKSKEELFGEIRKIATSVDLKQMKTLVSLPINAKKKIMLLSQYLIKKLKEDQMFAAAVTLGTQELLENHDNWERNVAYECETYRLLSIIVEQGQKEKTVVPGDVMKLVDYYWGVVYLYALKRVFTENFSMIDANDLARIMLKG